MSAAVTVLSAPRRSTISPLYAPGISKGTSEQSAKQPAWNVIHTCNSAHELMLLVEAQCAVGMQPSALTCAVGPGDDISPDDSSASLLDSWHNVRQWRKALMEANALAADLVHAHSFPAGMAAVRSCPAVVYDLNAFVEDAAIAQNEIEEKSWLARSFRVAEQFVLSRAAAVVVHSQAMRDGALLRGASSECLFVVPEPMDLNSALETTAGFRPESWRHSLFIPARTAVFYLPGAERLLRSSKDGKLHPQLELLLQAMNALAAENERATLVLLAAEQAARPLLQRAIDLGVEEHLRIVSDGNPVDAMLAADVIVAGEPLDNAHEDRVAALLPNPSALAAMQSGQAVLAADVTWNREVSRDGRGCLWYRPGDVRDLAHRAAFLARNPDLRRALGVAGRQHLESTRSVTAVGAMYREVYRSAFERRRGSRPGGPMAGLQPLQVCI